MTTPQDFLGTLSHQQILDGMLSGMISPALVERNNAVMLIKRIVSDGKTVSAAIRIVSDLGGIPDSTLRSHYYRYENSCKPATNGEV
jgi:hypothetical protein